MTMPWEGNSKIENDLMGVENACGAEFVKMHSPLPYEVCALCTILGSIWLS